MNKSLAVGAASAALVLALTACGDSGTDQSATSTPMATTSAGAAQDGAGEHNDADVAFAQGMVPHHSQAIEMSDMLLAKQGIDPRVVDLAQQIKAAQGPEIEQMNSWLTEWGQPAPSGMTMTESMPMSTGMVMPEAPPVVPPATSGMDMPGMEGGDMEGMMSTDDMAALEAAQGVDAAKLFLTQMIEHHQGAITMAQTEVDDGQNPAAVQLAQNIITTQQQEITTMEQILSTL